MADCKYRWAVEFLAGPPGFVEKAEVVSDWFNKLDEAREHALKNTEREMYDYGDTRGTIIKWVIEDNKGGTIVELKDAKKTVIHR